MIWKCPKCESTQGGEVNTVTMRMFCDTCRAISHYDPEHLIEDTAVQGTEIGSEADVEIQDLRQLVCEMQKGIDISKEANRNQREQIQVLRENIKEIVVLRREAERNARASEGNAVFYKAIITKLIELED